MMLSRFRTRSQQKRILDGLAGDVDIGEIRAIHTRYGGVSRVDLIECSGIREHRDAFAGIDQEVVVAVRADMKILLKFKIVDHRATIRALVPKAFRHVFTAVVAA